jgi:hypothetical protein
LDHGIPAPWIDVEAPNKPKGRYIGEKEIFSSEIKNFLRL